MKQGVLTLGALAFAISNATFAEAQPVSPSRASALTTIANRLASELESAPAGSLIVAAPLASDEAAPRAEGLVARIGSALGGAMGNGVTARPDPLSLSAARSAGRRAGSFVYVRAEVIQGELRVSADLYPVAQSIWDRILRPNPPPTLHSFASARLDAEVRSFLAPVPLVLGRIERGATDDRDLVAIACGDVDDDGALELITVGRRRIARGRLRHGKFTPSHVAPWSGLAAVAPAPLREPMGGIALLRRDDAPGSFIDVGLTDRAHGVRLDEALRPRMAIAGLPIPLGDRDACAMFPNGNGVPNVSACAPGDSPVDFGAFSGPADLVTTGTIITKDGTALTVLAVRDPSSGDLRLVSKGFVATIPAAGAQVAIADLDGDGDPEIITGTDALSPSEDALVVSSWRPGDPVRERARITVPPGVRGIAACPPNGPGPAPIAIATAGGEVWVVQ